MRIVPAILLALFASACTPDLSPDTSAARRALATPGLAELARAYGLGPSDRLAGATLGRRVRMALHRPGPHGAWQAAVQELQVWRAPLMLDGGALALVTLAVHEGAMQAVELGAEVLARELAGAPAPANAALTLLRSHALGGDFLVWGEGPDRRALPLASARRALALPRDALTTGALLDLLREARP